MNTNTNTPFKKCIRIRIHYFSNVFEYEYIQDILKLKHVISDINIYLCTYIQYVYIITEIILFLLVLSQNATS